MTAKFEERKIDLHIGDLVWLLAKHYYKIETPPPSEMELMRKKADRRSASEIKDSILKRLKGA